MRGVLVVLGIASVVLPSCGEGPLIYKVAIDLTPLQDLPGTCYAGGQIPVMPAGTRNQYKEQQWALWEEGPDEQYLQIETMATIPLGDAERIQLVGDTIRGREGDFRTDTTLIVSNGTRTLANSLAVTFTETTNKTRGVVWLKSTCNNCVVKSCEASFRFYGRRIDGYPEVIYTPGGN